MVTHEERRPSPPADRLHPQIYFQPRSQSHRHSVLLPGAVLRVCGHGAVAADAHPPGVAERQAAVYRRAGMMTPEQYLALVTMHGSIMVFMVLTTAPQSGFGNYMLPIQIGAEDMAFPVLNMLSFWTTFVSLVVLVSAFFVTGGAPISGWTAYPTLSALGQITGPGQGAGQTLWVIGLAIFCIASLLGALNFITTTVDLRAKGMTLGPHAAHGVGLADHRDSGLAGVRRIARGLHPAAARPHRRERASSFPAAWWSPIRPSPGTRAARRCFGSTCSGSSAIRRFTSPFCRAWAWRRTCSRRFRASRCSATRPWSARWAPSASWASAFGATTCSSAA